MIELFIAATVVCAKMVSFSKNPENGKQPHEETLNSFHEIFSQDPNGLQADTSSALVNNSGRTIFERTKEKSVAESRATIQKRLHDMQKLIVPKYIQLPLVSVKSIFSFTFIFYFNSEQLTCMPCFL